MDLPKLKMRRNEIQIINILGVVKSFIEFRMNSKAKFMLHYNI
jgi:hypothetical protein